MKRFFAASILFFSTALTLPVQAQTDFDGDGISDLVSISIRSDSSLLWRYKSSKTGKVRNITTLGGAGSQIALANWQESKPQVALVAPSNGTSAMLWSIRNNAGTLNTFELGTTSDLAVSGADFDGNGESDAAAVVLDNGRYLWKILLNPLSSQVTREMAWGGTGDQAFYWHDATGADKLAVIRRNTSNGLDVYLKDLMSDTNATIPLSRSVSSFERPFTILNGSSSTYLVLPVKESSTTRFYIYRSDGSYYRSIILNSTDTYVVGNYLSKLNGDEIAIKKSRSFIVYNPFAKTGSVLAFNSQIPVDAININALGSWGGVCAEYNPRDGSKRGFTWKPNSDTQYYAVAVIPANYTGKIAKMEALTSAGVLIKEIGLKNCGNPDSVGNRCNYQDRSLTGADYKKMYGSIILKMTLNDKSCVTFFLNDPSKRID